MAQELKPGAMLRHNTYRIERTLGQGGFGITYLAYDLSLERMVAIKEFFPKDYCLRHGATSHVTTATQSAHDVFERYKVKFLKEARNIAKFDDPGIIKIHAAFEENNTAYYVMDFIDGVSLEDMVEQHGPMGPQEAVGYIKGVAEALEYVHRRRINHLDVKPANIMVRRSDRRPVLIDFGLAKQYDDEGHQTSTTPTGLSHGYAPIEQYTAGGVQQFSPQTDLYSLAATLFYLISGQVPPQAVVLVEQGLQFPDAIPMAMRIPMATAMSSARGQRQPSVMAFVNALTASPGNDATQIMPEVAVRPQPVRPVAVPAPPVSPMQQTPATPPIKPANPDKAGRSKDRSKGKYVGLIGGLIGLAVAGVIMSLPKKSEEGVAPDPEPIEVTVTDRPIETDLGAAIYTGQLDELELPHGEGRIVFTGGENEGDSYKGGFVHGTLAGYGVYTLKNGDVFDGTLVNNRFKSGKYTVKESGDYFKGTFGDDDTPDKGTWYKADGTKL